ncbi:NAD(P)-dependent oxidoreductase [Rhodococcus sp. NPDC056506]|uniref:NAD(P)-dependent oxidoreductase n=1 Tax=Rhodococcus sp. NPDC056506 TaxID=3345844 RepID=UPI00366D169E
MTESASEPRSPKPSSSKPRLGYIGLGNMGAPMATRLLDWPGGLVVCDARPEALEPFTTAGAGAASTPAEVAARASIISVTVLDDAQVCDVVDGPHGILTTARPGTVVAIHSTISDTTAVELARICEVRGVLLIDAPISGGAGGAAQGRLAVMIGGSEEAFEAVREPFGCWAELVVRAGDVGAGTRMKLARNLLHFVSFTATTEAARLAEAAGLNLRTLGKVVRHTDAITGGAGAIMLRDTTAPVSEDDPWFSILQHVRNLGEKDLALAIDLGDRLNLELPLAHLALSGLGVGLGVDHGDGNGDGEPSPASTTREHA